MRLVLGKYTARLRQRAAQALRPLAGVFLIAALAADGHADEFIRLSDEQLNAVQRELADGYTNGKISTDAVLQQYVSDLNARLKANPRTYVTFVKDNNLNAFAAWGNVIVINSGILGFAESEGDLAGVLAHEHAHITQRHFHRLPEAASLVRGVTAAGILIALLAGNADLANAFAGASGLAANKELASLREFELEADRQAVRTMTSAGFNPDPYLGLLSRMKKPSESSTPEYLRTHPFSENRVSDLRAFIRSLRLGDDAAGDEDLIFWLARERSNWLAIFQGGPSPPATLADTVRDYGLLIRDSSGSTEAAERLAEHAENWIIALELADHHLAQGNVETAIETLERARASAPSNNALAAKHLYALAQAKDRKRAVKTLAKMPSDMRLNWDVAQAEARLWSALGDTFSYRLAVGFSQYLDGDLASAKKQVARLKSLDASATSNSNRGRLILLEQKIESLQSLLQ